jgi:hypothetical protein
LNRPTDRNRGIDPQGRPRRPPRELDRTPDVVYESLDLFGVAHRVPPVNESRSDSRSQKTPTHRVGSPIAAKDTSP